jgi:hypothetical protein
MPIHDEFSTNFSAKHLKLLVALHSSLSLVATIHSQLCLFRPCSLPSFIVSATLY